MKLHNDKTADLCFYVPIGWQNSFITKLNKNSFEPDLNQRPMDVWYITTTVHRSTNWAIEGWMVAMYKAESILIISNNVLELHTYLSLLLKDLHMLEYWCQHGDVAQMVERSLSMWEVGGSIPPVSKSFERKCLTSKGILKIKVKQKFW